MSIDIRKWHTGQMSQIDVTAGKTLLEACVKTPPIGLSELIWNAFDEDASNVTISLALNPIGGLSEIKVADDGHGMNRERANLSFATVGDSWKIPGSTSTGGRPLHGRHGRGRYAAFALGNSVTWESTSDPISGGSAQTVRITGGRSNLRRFEIEEMPAGGRPVGTTVSISLPTNESIALFDRLDELTQHLLTQFALHLDRHKDFTISLLGRTLNPKSVILGQSTIELDLPAEVPGAANITVIEWDLQNVERRLYLCTTGGSIVDELQPGVKAVGAEFTCYLTWEGFEEGQTLTLEGDDESPRGKVILAARAALRTHLSESARKRESVTLDRWRNEGVYPYSVDPKTPVERATRDTFNIVAMAASRTVDESKSVKTKAMALSLLKEALERDPESLLPILKNFSQLPAPRIEELRNILERTTLSQLITTGRAIGDRFDLLNGLSDLIFGKETKRRMRERTQLHRILAHETWLFGEEWSLTGDDVRLTEVLKNFLGKLGEDVTLADAAPVLREDDSDGIPDLVFGRQLETKANHYAHLVVELKRPSHKLNDEDVAQIRSYASAITNDDRFDQPNASWEFWLVGNETNRAVDESRDQEGQPYGLVQNSKRYKIIVKTWAEIFGDAKHRMKFVQDSLQYESDRDSGLAHMRDRYSRYLPDVALEDGDADSAAA